MEGEIQLVMLHRHQMLLKLALIHQITGPVVSRRFASTYHNEIKILTFSPDLNISVYY